MKAILFDSKDGQEIQHEFPIGNSAPRDIVRNERVNGDKEENTEYLYRLLQVRRDGSATYRYSHSRKKPVGMVPNPRIAR